MGRRRYEDDLVDEPEPIEDSYSTADLDSLADEAAHRYEDAWYGDR